MTGEQIELSGVSDLSELVSFMTSVLARDAPIMNCLGMTERELRPFADATCRAAQSDDLAFVAHDRATRKVIGFALAQDHLTRLNVDLRIVSAKYIPLRELFEKVGDDYLRTKQNVKKGELLYLSHWGVDQVFCRTARLPSPARILFDACLARGQARGYRECYTFPTNFFTFRVLEKAGFSEFSHLEYSDYYYEGKAIFAHLRPHRRCAIYARPFGHP